MLYQCFSVIRPNVLFHYSALHAPSRNSFIGSSLLSLIHSYYRISICNTEIEKYYAAIGGIVVVVSLVLLAAWRKHVVSSLSHIVGAFILISAATNLFDAKRNITSSSVNELSLIILRRSNLGVCNSSIFLGRVNSPMRLGLMLSLKSLLLWCS
jgi:drug/metabolite transporter superfamily protein YnfA